MECVNCFRPMSLKEDIWICNKCGHEESNVNQYTGRDAILTSKGISIKEREDKVEEKKKRRKK